MKKNENKEVPGKDKKFLNDFDNFLNGSGDESKKDSDIENKENNFNEVKSEYHEIKKKDEIEDKKKKNNKKNKEAKKRENKKDQVKEPKSIFSRNKKLFFLTVILVVIIIGGLLFWEIINVANNHPNPPKIDNENKISVEVIKEKLAKQGELKKFENYSQVKEYLSQMQNQRGHSIGGFSPTMGMAEAGIVAKDMTNSTESFAPQEADVIYDMGGASDNFSETNIQVAGVDEADIIKNDGKYIYAVTQKNLYIVLAYPSEDAEVLAKIEFDDLPRDIYINNDKLIVFGSDSRVFTNKEEVDTFSGIRKDEAYTFFKIFDISDRKNPQQIRDIKFEGNYFNSRMIGDEVYFLTSKYARYYDTDFVLPTIIEKDKLLYNFKDEQCDNCPSVYYADIPDYGSYNFVNVATVNLDDEEINNSIYLLPSSQNLYVSQDNIYITYTKYLNESELMTDIMTDIIYPNLSDSDKELVQKIRDTDSGVLTASEKNQKIQMVFEKYIMGLSEEEAKDFEKKSQEKIQQEMDHIAQEVEKTVIHKIKIDKGNLSYQGSGEVTGSVLNQFSMDEKNGNFRIATTRNQRWWGVPMPMIDSDTSASNNSIKEETKENELETSENYLFVLDKDLKTIGTLEDLAKGERIYSVRFMQDRAYLVTFKQMDPLFVISLKDPKKPEVLGELKVPGFSNYLHPYNENILIGLGKETEANDHGGFTTKGLKLSMFDVSEVNNPKEIDKYVFDNSTTNSIATNEHKAFLFSKKKNLISFPITMSNASAIKSYEDMLVGEITNLPVPKFLSAAAVFNVDEKGFKLKGLIDHSEGKKGIGQNSYGRNYYDSTIKRSLYIDDILYTFSNKFIEMNEISDLKSVGEISLEKEDDEDHRVVN